MRFLNLEQFSDIVQDLKWGVNKVLKVSILKWGLEEADKSWQCMQFWVFDFKRGKLTLTTQFTVGEIQEKISYKRSHDYQE